MNKKTIKKINYIPFIIFFLILLYFSLSIGLKGDDFKYILRSSFNCILPNEKVSSVYHTIQSAYYDYLMWNGRFVTTIILMNILRLNLKIYQLLNSLIITLSLFFGLKMAKGNEFDSLNDLFVNTIILISFFSMTPSLLDDTVFWITGSVYYAWAIFPAVIFIGMLLTNEPKDDIFSNILFLFSSIVVAFSIENFSISVLLISIITVIYNALIKHNKEYFKKNRKIFLILFWILNIIELLSPGSRIRASGSKKSIYNTIISGTCFFFQSQFISGKYIPLILIVLLSFCVKKFNKRIFLFLLIFSFPLFIVFVTQTIAPNSDILYKSYISSFIIEPNGVFMIVSGHRLEKLIVLLYYFFLSCIISYSFYIVYSNEKDISFILLFMLCFLPNAILLPLGGSSERTSYFSQIFMLFSICKLFHKLNIDFVLSVTITFILLFILSSFMHKFSYLSSNVKVNMIREKIYLNIWSNKVNGNIIKIPKYRFSILGNFESGFSYKELFKKYYLGLDDSYDIEFVDRKEFGVKW